MHLIIRYFPESITKSQPVRKKLAQQLQQNVKVILKRIQSDISVRRDWEKLEVIVPDSSPAEINARVLKALGNIPGIDSYSEVVSTTFSSPEDIAEFALSVCKNELTGKTFCVRVKRHGEHPFSSVDIERKVGGYLLHHSEAKGVELKKPEMTVRLDVKHERLFLLSRTWSGLGGYPLGSQDQVLSLLSGGFDSSVASYMTTRRGMITHFLFFNLGGRAHEIGVREMAFHLWNRFGESHRVKFISVPFESVVNEIMSKTQKSYNAVILKRMMMRAASQVASKMRLPTLVTGEAVAQVSSQTLANLAVVDSVCDKLVLRPLITMDKRDIIDLARQIGTEEAAAAMPEYCGVVSSGPTTRAQGAVLEAEESQFDSAVLETAVANMKVIAIDEIMEGINEIAVDMVASPLPGSEVIDVRHPDEIEDQALHLTVPVTHIPYYQMQSAIGDLDPKTTYLLYCDKGIMSRLHAEMLIEAGHRNVGVYRPDLKAS